MCIDLFVKIQERRFEKFSLCEVLLYVAAFGGFGNDVKGGKEAILTLCTWAVKGGRVAVQ